jgi:conjugative transfer region protein TrbK
MNRISRLVAVGAVALTVSFTMPPSWAQVVVFDPNNYAQNVLTAARALQQINNQITSLQNQTQMLINQAKNLASLPFSSLQQLQSSIQRTQQLLNQAQRIAYDVQQIDRAFDHLRPGLGGDKQSDTDIKCARTLADLRRGVAGCAAGASRRRRQSRYQPHTDVGACNIKPVRNGSLAGNPSRQPAVCPAGPATRRSHSNGRCPRACSEPGSRTAHLRPGPGPGAASPFPDAGRWLPTHNRSDVPLMSSYLTSRRVLRVAAVAFVMLAAAVAVIQSRRGEDAAVLAPAGRGEADPLVGELARCRTVTSDDTADLDACRRMWAENRQHFFISMKSPQLPAPPAPNAPSVPVKSEGRVPSHEVDQGRAR